MLPNPKNLDQVSQKIKQFSNQRGEHKRKIHYGCYLLGYKSGLRVSEAINFDLTNKTKNGLYRIIKTKGKKERLVYIPKEVIRELKKNNWQPNQTNRHNFYHFLRKIKRELKISKKIELTPHTLRRSFTTHHANSGMPLPLLQRLLGHSSPRTTALYWKDIHGNGNNTANILAGKKWLEGKNEPPESPSTENFPKQSPRKFKPITKNKLAAPSNLLLNTGKENNLTVNYQPQPVIKKISPKILEKFFLNASEQLPLITSQGEKQSLVRDQKEVILLTKIKHLEEQLRKTVTERDNLKIEKEKAEAIVVTEKQTNDNLYQQLQTERKNNLNLTQKLHAYKQNYTNLLTAYQSTIKEKQKSEILAQSEKKRADNYAQQLKTIARMLYQWQKINYYQQLEKERNELKTQIVQPPPWIRWKN